MLTLLALAFRSKHHCAEIQPIAYTKMAAISEKKKIASWFASAFIQDFKNVFID